MKSLAIILIVVFLASVSGYTICGYSSTNCVGNKFCGYNINLGTCYSSATFTGSSVGYFNTSAELTGSGRIFSITTWNTESCNVSSISYITSNILQDVCNIPSDGSVFSYIISSSVSIIPSLFIILSTLLILL